MRHVHFAWAGWAWCRQRRVGCLKLQVVFRKRATNYRALLQQITYKYKASYGSSPPCTNGYMCALQCVAVCCSALQCVAVCCGVRCSVLQCVEVCSSVQQCAAVCCGELQCVAVCCGVLRCVAVCCGVIQMDTPVYINLHGHTYTFRRTHMRTCIFIYVYTDRCTAAQIRRCCVRFAWAAWAFRRDAPCSPYSVVVCCSVVAVRRSVLQCVAVLLQCVAVCCSVLQCVLQCCMSWAAWALCCSVLQCCCSVCCSVVCLELHEHFDEMHRSFHTLFMV